MSKKPGILRNLRVKRVALVDKGANFDVGTGDGAHIMLYKRAANKSLGSVHVDSPDWDVSDMDDYEKADLTSEGRRGLPDSAFAAVWTDAQGKKHRKLPIHDAGHLAAARGRISQAQMPADVKAAAERKIKAKENHVKKSIVEKILGLFSETDVEKRNAAAAEILKAADAAEPDADDKDKKKKPADDMAKDDDVMKIAVAKAVEDVEKRHKDEVAKLEKQNKDLAASIEIEKNNRLDREMVDVLKSFKATPFDLDKDVVKFRKLKEESPEAFERTMEIFKATDAQLAASAVYKNFGSGREGGRGNAWEQLEAKATALVEKNSSLSPEKALEKIMLDPKNNDLVKQYREQQQ